MSHEEQVHRPRYKGGSETKAALAMQLTYALVLGAVCPIAPVMLYVWVIRSAPSLLNPEAKPRA